MYIGGRNSGLLGAWDITDRAHPKMVWMYDVAPPEAGPHTITPIVYKNLPYHTAPALPRTFALVTDETSNCRTGVMAKATMFDITHETNPMPVSMWQVPIAGFCEKGGRFGSTSTRNRSTDVSIVTRTGLPGSPTSTQASAWLMCRTRTP